MFSKLTFGQKLAVWLGMALLLMAGSFTAIFFQLSKNPPKDMDKLVPQWANLPSLHSDETYKKTEEFSSLQIEQNPKAAFWYKERGYARWWLKKHKEAADDFSKAIELDPNDSQSYGYRGQLRTYLKEYKLAVEDLNKAIEMRPKEGRYYYNRGVAHDWLKDSQHALDDYKKALELNYDLVKVYNARGGLYLRLKKYDLALREYEAASQINVKDQADSIFEPLAKLYIWSDQLDKAQVIVERWIEESPKEDDAFDLAISLAKAAKDKKAEENWRKKHIENLTERIAISQDNSLLYETRAYEYSSLGDKPRAKADFEKSVEAENKNRKNRPPSHWLLANRASFLKNIGLNDEATAAYKQELKLLNQEIQKKPNQKELLMERGYTYLTLNESDAAIKDFEKAGAKENMYQILSAKLDKAIADGQFETALKLRKQLGMGSTYSHSQMARILIGLKKYSEAIDEAKKAVELDYENESAYYWHGKAMEAQGFEEGSAKLLKQAIALGFNESDED